MTSLKRNAKQLLKDDDQYVVGSSIMIRALATFFLKISKQFSKAKNTLNG
jgi:hypothetical protein